MKGKKDNKTVVKIKKDQTQKIIVEQSRHPMFGEYIPYKVLYTEIVKSVEKAKERVEQLKTEYPNTSIHFFSI